MEQNNFPKDLLEIINFFGREQLSEFTVSELYKAEFNKFKDNIFIKNVVWRH